MKRNNGMSIVPELPSIFNDSLLRDWFNWPLHLGSTEESGTVPAVNIRETDHEYEILMAVPGMTKNDFKVELENNRLVISGERKQENEQKDSNYLRKEFSYQSFVRSFTLPEKQVNGDKIRAKYTDGVLYITVPKSAEAKTKLSRVIPLS
jgi:HSP20 family protein